MDIDVLEHFTFHIVEWVRQLPNAIQKAAQQRANVLKRVTTFVGVGSRPCDMSQSLTDMDCAGNNVARYPLGGISGRKSLKSGTVPAFRKWRWVLLNSRWWMLVLTCCWPWARLLLTQCTAHKSSATVGGACCGGLLRHLSCLDRGNQKQHSSDPARTSLKWMFRWAWWHYHPALSS